MLRTDLHGSTEVQVLSLYCLEQHLQLKRNVTSFTVGLQRLSQLHVIHASTRGKVTQPLVDAAMRNGGVNFGG